MKTSLVCTVKNERETIRDLLDSIVRQTIKPDETIVVDGGSTDRTVDVIRSYRGKIKNLRVIVSKGANISKGRNIAIAQARGDVILATDGGCILDKDWTENLGKHYPAYDVVSGTYEPIATNNFEYFQGAISAAPRERQNTVSRMSSRSFSFKKAAWKRVGGYPEGTYTGEDTLFNIKLRDAGFKIYNEKDAVARWRMRRSWEAFARQYYVYGRGDRTSGNLFRMKANLLFIVGFYAYTLLAVLALLINPAITAMLIVLATLYFIIAGGVLLCWRTRRLKGLLYGTVLLYFKRVSYAIGVLV